MDTLFEHAPIMLIWYWIMQWNLYEFEKPHKSLLESTHSVIINDEKHTSPGDIVSAIVEYGILNRYSFFGYKNAVRSNIKLVSAFMLSILLLAVFLILYKFLCGQEVCPALQPKELIIGWAGFFVSSFIIERKMLYDKWQYLASLYNDVISRPHDCCERQVMEVALAIDLLDMEMWSHRSFRTTFSNVLKEAIAYDSCLTSRIFKHDAEYIETNPVPKGQVRDLLSRFQLHAVDRSRKKLCKEVSFLESDRKVS